VVKKNVMVYNLYWLEWKYI